MEIKNKNENLNHVYVYITKKFFLLFDFLAGITCIQYKCGKYSLEKFD